jgi:hypothetical protein
MPGEPPARRVPTSARASRPRRSGSLERHGPVADQEASINKPFALADLTEKVRQILDAQAPGPGVTH